MASEAVRAIEAILMVADQPVEPHLLAQLLEVSADRVDGLCAELATAYELDERGFALVRVAGGYRFSSHPDLAAYVERFVLEGQSSRLSAAALETLAIVAYKQPVSRAQVSAIRGVDVDGVMRTLQQRGYIAETARDPGPGQAVLFGTTAVFLEKLGLYELADLPPLGEFVPDARVVEALEAGLRPEPAHGGTSQGGVPQGGVPQGGVPQGGVPQGGVPQGGVQQGGVQQGGVQQGGVPPTPEPPPGPGVAPGDDH